MNSPYSVQTAVQEYLEHRAIQGATAQTLEDLTRYLRDFSGWLGTHPIRNVGELNEAVLRGYARFIFEYRKRNGKPLANASKLAKLVPVRVFLHWLAKRRHIDPSLTDVIELPPRAQMLPRRVLSSAEIEKVMATPDTAKPEGLRDRAMLELLYATGVRRMELAQLELCDVDLHRGILRVRSGKGNKDRRVPIGPRAQAWMGAYLDRARPLLAAAPEAANILFPDQRGRAFRLACLSSRMASYVRKSKVSEIGACHVFRHSMATLMLDGGADIRYIQVMLGHAQLSTTQIYTHVSTSRLEQVHLTTHPGARDFKGRIEFEVRS